MDVLCEEFAVVLAGNGEPVEVAVGTEITEADGVVEVFLSECGKISDVVAAEQDRSREGDVVHSSEIAPQRNASCALGATRFLLYKSQKMFCDLYGVAIKLQKNRLFAC